MRAPGKFVESLRRKAASAGDLEICEFPTHSTRLSQTCICGNIQKKPLSQRWHSCDCGVYAQRDRWSALLAACVEVDSLNADLVQPRWLGIDRCLQAALRDIPQLANGQPLPSSFGLSRRRQSESPVKVLLNPHETCVAVPPSPFRRGRENPGACCSCKNPPAFRRGECSDPTAEIPRGPIESP